MLLGRVYTCCNNSFLTLWARYFNRGGGIVRNSVGVVVMSMYSVYQQTIKQVIGCKSE